MKEIIHRLFDAGILRSIITCLVFFILVSSTYAGDFYMEWEPNTQPDLDGYRVYYGAASGDYNPAEADKASDYKTSEGGAWIPIGSGVTAITVDSSITEIYFQGLDDNKRYFFAATAFDDYDRESDYSNEIFSFGITDITPSYICGTTGGETITIEGRGFKEGITVLFGSDPVTDVTFISSTQITCITPEASTYGYVDVTVTNPSPYPLTHTLEDGYAYLDCTIAFEIVLDGDDDPYLIISDSTPSTLALSVVGADGECSWQSPELGYLVVDSSTESAIYYAPDSISSSVVTVTITVEDQGGHSDSLEITLARPVSIVDPAGYDEDDIDTYPILTGDDTIYTVTASGGPPASETEWTWIIKDLSDNTIYTTTSSSSDSLDIDVDTIFDADTPAGIYEVTASKLGITYDTLYIRVPMRISPLTGIYTEGIDDSVLFTISRSPGSLTWEIVDEVGEEFEYYSVYVGDFNSNPTSISGEVTNILTFADNLNFSEIFRVQALSQDLAGTGLDTVITDKHQIVIAVIEAYYVQVNDADTNTGVSGVSVVAVHDQSFNAVTDASGVATIENLENTGVTYEFAIMGPSDSGTYYLPMTFKVSEDQLASGGTTVTITSIDNTDLGIIDGDVDLFNAESSVTSAIKVSLDNEEPVVLADADGNFTLMYDTTKLDGTEPRIVRADKSGYVTNVYDNAGIADNVLDNESGVTILLKPTTKIHITDTYDGVNPDFDFSITSNESELPFLGNIVYPYEIQVFEGVDTGGTPLDIYWDSSSSSYNGSTSFVNDDILNFYVLADASTDGRIASEDDTGYYAKATHTVIQGVTISGTTEIVIDDPNEGGIITLELPDGYVVEADLPPGGVNTLESVTLSLGYAGTVTINGEDVYIYIISLTYTATGEAVPDDLIEFIVITIPFDPVIAEGSLEDEERFIWHGDDLASMVDGDVESVPVDQIMTTDYVNGSVIFYVDELSVFGVGPSYPSTRGGNINNEYSSGDCFISFLTDGIVDYRIVISGFAGMLVLFGVGLFIARRHEYKNI